MNSLARLRISWASIADERSKRLADVVTDHQIGDVVLLGGLVVDDDQLGATVLGHHWKAGGRPHHQRRSDRDEEIAMLRQFGGAAHLVFRHRLAKGNGRGLDRLVANCAVRRPTYCIEALFDPRQIVSLPATNAAGIGGVTMK